jgi:hypothetical protein
VAWGNRAMLYCFQQKPELAKADFDKCLRLDPSLRATYEEQMEQAKLIPAYKAWFAELAKARMAGAKNNICSQYWGTRQRACQHGDWDAFRNPTSDYATRTYGH